MLNALDGFHLLNQDAEVWQASHKDEIRLIGMLASSNVPIS
jgi:hypothetical protein